MAFSLSENWSRVPSRRPNIGNVDPPSQKFWSDNRPSFNYSGDQRGNISKIGRESTIFLTIQLGNVKQSHIDIFEEDLSRIFCLRASVYLDYEWMSKGWEPASHNASRDGLGWHQKLVSRFSWRGTAIDTQVKDTSPLFEMPIVYLKKRSQIPESRSKFLISVRERQEEVSYFMTEFTWASAGGQDVFFAWRKSKRHINITIYLFGVRLREKMHRELPSEPCWGRFGNDRPRDDQNELNFYQKLHPRVESFEISCPVHFLFTVSAPIISDWNRA
jgi:hypothetical protein